MVASRGVLKIRPFAPVGTVAGELTVIAHRFGSRGACTHYECCCSCGAVTRPTRANFDRGASRACPSCAKQRAGQSLRKYHGVMPDDALRAMWSGRHAALLSRCHDVGNKQFRNYGARGIYVCGRWLNRENFLRDIQKLTGWDDPAIELDRWDNGGGYWLGNVRMATRKENCRNTRRARLVWYKGVAYCAAEFHTRFAPAYKDKSTVARKIREGKSAERIILDQQRARRARNF